MVKVGSDVPGVELGPPAGVELGPVDAPGLAFAEAAKVVLAPAAKEMPVEPGAVTPPSIGAGVAATLLDVGGTPVPECGAAPGLTDAADAADAFDLMTTLSASTRCRPTKTWRVAGRVIGVRVAPITSRGTTRVRRP